MKEDNIMVKYGVDEQELEMEKTAGRGQDKISTTLTKEELIVNVSDKRAKPVWKDKKAAK